MANQCRVVKQLSQARSPSSVWELALVECPIPMDLVWMVMTRCYRCGYILFFYVWFQCYTRGRALSYGGEVLICSPWYVLVAFVWDIVGHIFFFWCIHCTVHRRFFICCSLVVNVPNVGGWVQIPVCSLL